MNNFEKIYQLIGGIIVPITFLLAFVMLPSAIVSFGNPSVLFGLFVFVCVVIYVVKSTQFFRRNILGNTSARASAKHLIYINGAFALFFFLQICMVFFVVYLMPNVFKDALKMASEQVSAQMGENFPVEKIYGMLKIIVTVLFVYSLLLAVHVVMSFVLVRKYRDLFNG